MRQNKTDLQRRGRPTGDAIRWNLQLASREFGVHREQLERRRRALAIEPGDDECFTSQQILAMIHGDKEAETIGKLSAERRKLEIECAKLEGELARVVDFDRFLEVLFVPIRQEICSSGLPDETIDKILERLIEASQRDWKEELRNIDKKAR